MYEKIKFVKENYETIKKEYKQGIEIEKYTSNYVLNQVKSIYNEVI